MNSRSLELQRIAALVTKQTVPLEFDLNGGLLVRLSNLPTYLTWPTVTGKSFAQSVREVGKGVLSR